MNSPARPHDGSPDKASRFGFNVPRRTAMCDGTCQLASTVTLFYFPLCPPLVTIKGRGGQGLDLHRIAHHLPGLGLDTLSRPACNPYYEQT
jgi:hypothetical protein